MNKQQLQAVKERFLAFLNGETQIVADEAFCNAVRSYYEARPFCLYSVFLWHVCLLLICSRVVFWHYPKCFQKRLNSEIFIILSEQRFILSKNIVISISSGGGGPQHQLSSFHLQLLWQKLAGKGHSMGHTARRSYRVVLPPLGKKRNYMLNLHDLSILFNSAGGP